MRTFVKRWGLMVSLKPVGVVTSQLTPRWRRNWRRPRSEIAELEALKPSQHSDARLVELEQKLADANKIVADYSKVYVEAKAMMQAGAGRHRVEAQGFVLPQRPLIRLAQDEKPACAAVRREAGEDWGW